MKLVTRVLPVGMFLFLLFSSFTLADDITSVKKGLWNDPTTWSTGVIPVGTDNVTISLTDTVTVDTVLAECNNLAVNGMLRFSQTQSVAMTVNGDIVVNSGATFRLLSNAIGGNLVHTIALYGSITNNGTFDMKNGSANATLSICTISFLGSNNSTVTMNGGYTTVNNEFGGVTINKSGNGRVILGNNMYLPSGSSAVTTPGGNPVLTFVRGIVETGPHALIHLYTNNLAVVGSSDSSYVLGNMGRGMTNSGSPTDRRFDVGDSSGFRPVKVHAVSPGNATGHYMLVKLVPENANTGSSTFSGNIDKVWSVRYYQYTYYSGGVGATQMTFDRFTGSYGRSEGVAAGNTNLRVALSFDDRATWQDYGPTTVPHTTSLDTVPRYIASDSLITGIILHDGESMYLTLARATGTTENTLDAEPSAVVDRLPGMPAEYTLAQNYPNPFNPTTSIEYGIPTTDHVTLGVYNVLGQMVAQVVDEVQAPGTYRVTFNANTLPSGVYFYRITAGEFSHAAKMTIMK